MKLLWWSYEGLIDNDFAPWFLFKSITKKPTNQNLFLILKKRNMNSSMDYFCISDSWTFHQVILALLFVISLKILTQIRVKILISLSGTCANIRNLFAYNSYYRANRSGQKPKAQKYVCFKQICIWMHYENNL